MRRGRVMTQYRVAPATAVGDGYTIVENASLLARNTFHVDARAHILIDVRKPEALAELFGYAMLKTQPVLVLGEGSNVLFTRDWPGVVVSIAARGIALVGDDGDAVRVRVGAGENWNDLVRWTVGRGLAGLENLVLIPGTVGAAPIQNIGAYGVEVGESIVAVDAWDRSCDRAVRLDNADCAFGYRDSLFKSERDRYVVTAVEFQLHRHGDLRLHYAGVEAELASLDLGATTPATVAEAIARIRSRKLPNPALLGNAGSFFKNPLLPSAAAEALRSRHPGIALWEAGEGRAKVSAAWLIEAAGFKGWREGDAGVAEGHALVLVNHGGASGTQLWTLARRIVAGVHERFGIELEPEPLIV